MPPFSALTEPSFQRSPLLRGKALANVIAIAVGGLIFQGGQAALRRRRLLMLAEGRLGASQAWRVEGPWRPMARGVTMGDHPHIAQVLPLGALCLALTLALSVQNVQAALRLLCTGLDHDQGLPLPDRFGG